MMRRVTFLATLGVALLIACSAYARVEAEALLGRPFGVGQVTISGLEVAVDVNRVFLEEKSGRAFYPAVAPGVFGRLIGKLLGSPTDRPSSGVTVYFLFKGDQPLELTVYTPQPVTLVVQPGEDNARRFDRELTQWWRQYNTYWRNERADDNQPPIVATYLTTMLSQRLGLEPPLLERIQTREPSSQTTQALELLGGMERLRLDTLKNTMLGRGIQSEAANLPLPPEPAWSPLPLPANQPPAEIEPIALHVPHEWFYVRFGKFSNYLWLNHLLKEYGGDISSMVTLRSYLAPMNERIQDQFGLEPSVLGELLGDRVISDVALVGRDTFSREGPAMGILFQAINTKILKNDLTQQRDRALDRAMQSRDQWSRSGKGPRAETLTIANREVSFYSTPDNRLRSFYAVDGDYHLVTTSRAMVERFLTVNQGRGSLGNSAEFRLARQTTPITRNDTIFAYFSSAFFAGLFSPHYQVELERRMKSVTDIELLMLARLAAHGEQLRSDSVEDLIAGGLLPRGFGNRPDGSTPVTSGVEILDSDRGARGAFTPIPDVPITAITRAEATRLEALNAQLASTWRRMDPLMIAIQRTALNEPNRERLVIDGNINPLDESKYGWVLSLLGPPTRQMITPAQGDVISLQAAVKGGVLVPRIPPHHMFLGIQDIPPSVELPTAGLMQTLNFLRSTPGYIGSWPQAGFVDLLPFGLGGTPDPNGFSRLPFGAWRRQGGGFSVLSFDPQLLANITPQLRVTESEIEAQLRLHVEDLTQSKVRPWIKNLYYQRGLSASAGNARFLTLLSQQLHVPLSEAKATTENLLDARLNCPLGGDYQLVEDLNGGQKAWQSTSSRHRGTHEMGRRDVPEDFEAPLLKWFHGLDAHLTKSGDQITTRFELDIERHPTAPKVELPNFFNLGNLFGGGQKALKPKEKPAGEELPPPLPPVRDPPRLDPPRIPGQRDT